MGLQDLWLSKNRNEKARLEGSISASRANFEVQSTTAGGAVNESRENGDAYRFQIYLWRVGLEGEYGKDSQDFKAASGALAFRLLGPSLQNTNLTLKYGLLKMEDESNAPAENWRNRFAEVEANLYVLHFMGLAGSYRQIFADHSDLNLELSAQKTKGGIFFDLFFARIYASLVQEKIKRETPTGKLDIRHEGVEYGLSLFF